jgi:hypothetical protein
MTKHREKTLLFGLILGLVLASNTFGADDCRERLLGNSYACQFKFQVVTTTNGTDRVLVEAPLDAVIGFTDFTDDDNPGNAFVGTLVIDSDIRPTYCSCKVQGSFANPKFGDSPQDFFCVTGGGEDVGLMFEGQVNGSGETINHGELWFADPFFAPTPGNGQFRRGVFTCERD